MKMKKINEDLCPKRVRARIDWLARRGWRAQIIYRHFGQYIVELRKAELLPLFGYSELVTVRIDGRGKFFPIETSGESYCLYE